MCVYRNVLQFFCTELNVVDCLALIAMVKQKDLLTTQEHFIDDKIKHASGVLASEIPSVSVSDLQELLHWRTICNLIALLRADRQVLLREVEGSQSVSLPMLASDSHFHLEMLLREFQVSTLDKVERRVNCTVEFSSSIGNLCFQAQWENGYNIWDDRLWFSVGFHPRLATSFETQHYSRLKELLKGSRVVGLGEVGLDYTDPEYSWGAQRVLRRTLVSLAVFHNKVLVIHCRERAYGENQVGKDCRSILKKILPKYHSIHLHCFVGGLDEAKQWVDLFPNCCFGLASKFDYRCQTVDVVRHFQLDRFVLESDSLYLSYRKGAVSHHGLVCEVTKEVVFVLGMSWEHILCRTSVNTNRLYRIQFYGDFSC